MNPLEAAMARSVNASLQGGRGLDIDLDVYDEVEINPVAERLGLTQVVGSTLAGDSRKDRVLVLGKGSEGVVRKHVDTPRVKQAEFFGIAYTPVRLKHREGLDLDAAGLSLSRDGEEEEAIDTVDRFVSVSLSGMQDDDFEDEDEDEKKTIDGEEEEEEEEEEEVVKDVEREKITEDVECKSRKDTSRLARTQSTPEPRYSEEIPYMHDRRRSFAPLLSIIDTRAPLSRVRENHPETNEDLQQRLQELQLKQQKSKKHSNPHKNNNSCLSLPCDDGNGDELGEDTGYDNVRVLVDAPSSSSKQGSTPTSGKSVGKADIFVESVAHFRRLYERERSAKVFAHSSSVSSVKQKPVSPTKRPRFRRSRSLAMIRGLWKTSQPFDQSLQAEKELIRSVQQTPLDIGDPINRKLMQRLYASLTRASYETTCSMVGDHWRDVGFQGTNPGTDLRGAGMLAVLQMVWLDKTIKHEIMRTAKSSAVCQLPVMAVSINITVMCATALQKGGLDKLCKVYGSAWTAVNEVFQEMWRLLCAKWNRGEVGLVNFVKQLEGVQKQVLKSLKSKTKRKSIR